jgi:hypothetical protein
MAVAVHPTNDTTMGSSSQSLAAEIIHLDDNPVPEVPEEVMNLSS